MDVFANPSSNFKPITAVGDLARLPFLGEGAEQGGVGLSNYRFMFTSDPQFWVSVRNTLWIMVVLVPLQVVFGIATATVLTRLKRGVSFYRTVFFLPTMVPLVAAAVGFYYLLNPEGPINRILKVLHLPQPLWFLDPRWTKPGLTMIVILAALLDVPKQLYEAAEIEGANPLQRFRHVTLPMISPVVFFSVLIGMIQGFEGFHMGYAAALSWVMFIVIMACTAVIIRSSRRWVHYQGGFR